MVTSGGSKPPPTSWPPGSRRPEAPPMSQAGKECWPAFSASGTTSTATWWIRGAGFSAVSRAARKITGPIWRPITTLSSACTQIAHCARSSIPPRCGQLSSCHAATSGPGAPGWAGTSCSMPSSSITPPAARPNGSSWISGAPITAHSCCCLTRRYTPVAPSMRSRIRSAWPLWRAYSSIMWT
jgi:hypothetical protein